MPTPLSDPATNPEPPRKASEKKESNWSLAAGFVASLTRPFRRNLALIFALFVSLLLARALFLSSSPPETGSVAAGTTQSQSPQSQPVQKSADNSAVNSTANPVVNPMVRLERWRSLMLAALLGTALCCFGHLLDLQRLRNAVGYRAERLGGGMEGGIAVEGMLTLISAFLLLYMAMQLVLPHEHDQKVSGSANEVGLELHVSQSGAAASEKVGQPPSDPHPASKGTGNH